MVSVFEKLSDSFSAAKSNRGIYCRFYCAKARLIIEIDGKEHCSDVNYKRDITRTKVLEEMNLSVIRIQNSKIYDDFENVCRFIDLKIKESLPQSASLSAPSSEGAEKDGNK